MTADTAVTRIPVFDLKAQYNALKPELDEAALRVMASGWFVQGSEHAAFETEFAAYCEAQHAVPLRCEPVRFLLVMVARDRDGDSAAGVLPFAVIKYRTSIQDSGKCLQKRCAAYQRQVSNVIDACCANGPI